MLCDVFSQLNLQLWKTDAPALQVPEAILIQTLEKGTQGLARRRKEEYKLWESSKFESGNIFRLRKLSAQHLEFLFTNFRHGGGLPVPAGHRLRLLPPQRGGPQPVQHLAPPGIHVKGLPKLTARVSRSFLCVLLASRNAVPSLLLLHLDQGAVKRGQRGGRGRRRDLAVSRAWFIVT